MPVEHIHTDLSINYPPHPPRQETPLYVKSHHDLVYVQKRTCYVCRVSVDTLNDPAINRWGAKALETHHFLIEDSLLNAIDLDAWNATERPYLQKRNDLHGTVVSKYDKPFSADQFAEWVHGDEDNLVVVCDLHHRNNKVGIHAIPWPIWRVQFLLKPDYDLTGFKSHSVEEAKALTGLPQTLGTAIAP